MKNPFSAGFSGINALRALTVLAALAFVAQPVFSAIADGGRTAGVAAETADRIVFAPDGSVQGGGEITLTDVDGHSRRITVSPEGEIQVN